MKSMFSHTDGTSVLYDISWELFTWKSITILDSVYICWDFPTWCCWTYLMPTEPPALHSYSKIHTTSWVIKVWHGWNHRHKWAQHACLIFFCLSFALFIEEIHRTDPSFSQTLLFCCYVLTVFWNIKNFYQSSLCSAGGNAKILLGVNKVLINLPWPFCNNDTRLTGFITAMLIDNCMAPR